MLQEINTTDIQEEYSKSTTLITFPKPIPLLRAPIPTSPTDSPQLGPYILAFQNPSSFKNCLATCQSKLLEQCELGCRVGCSITASKKCTTPWWKGTVDFKERELCEEREMNLCLVGSKEKCVGFVQDKCLASFMSARVMKGKVGGGLFGLLSFNCDDDDDEVGYVRASEIMGSSDST